MQSNGSSETRHINDEFDLAEGCRRGDIEAYERLYRDHSARMKSIAFNMLGNRTDAEDAVQDTFVKVYHKAGQFKGRSAFETWIFRILVNVCHDLTRKKKRQLPRSETPLADNESMFNTCERGDLTMRLSLERTLEELPERKRMIFLLFEVEGFKHSEIAEILDIPEGTSKHLLFETRKALQESFGTANQSGRGYAL